MEWWWDQPNQPHVTAFVDRYRKAYASSTHRTPSARSSLGYVGMHSFALAADKAKSFNSATRRACLKAGAAPRSGLRGRGSPYRAGDHQCLLTEFVGEVNRKGTYPNLFTVSDEIAGTGLAQTPKEKGCKLIYPA